MSLAGELMTIDPNDYATLISEEMTNTVNQFLQESPAIDAAAELEKYLNKTFPTCEWKCTLNGSDIDIAVTPPIEQDFISVDINVAKDENNNDNN